jgi:CheY-like chemotaxis protein
MVHILVVEDDEVDTEALQRAFKKQNISYPLYFVPDGKAALMALRGEGSIVVPRPHLIFVDINMPRLNGFEFLRELRADNTLKQVLVFVLTSSDDEKDKIKAYNFNIAGYLLKDQVGRDFEHLIALIDHYSKYVRFPP